ncbi:GrpB family protein [Williamsia sp. R60]
MAFELIGGIEKRAIVLVPYDDAWPRAFERERRRIAAALGEVAIRIDHIGSTSIPGLVAKPVIDIDLSVADPDDEASYLPALESAGYRLRVREPGHRMVRTASLDVHVHICRSGSDWERRHLLFRDWLRHDARDREAYGELKKSLAQRNWQDMNAYASAKGPLIEEITARAEKWAEHGAWRGLEEES